MPFQRGAHAAEPPAYLRWLLPTLAGVAAAAAAVAVLVLQGMRRPETPTATPPASSAPVTATGTTTTTTTTTASSTTSTTTASSTTSTTTSTTKKTTKQTTARTTIPSVKPPAIKVESGDVSDDRVERTTRRTTRRTTVAGGYTPVRPDRVSLADLPHLYGSKNALVGIDVSRHNGEIDWAQVKAAGIRYAIIRCGYRTTVSGEVYEDANFRKNIRGALDAGIPVGVYFFSAAKTRAEALEEAAFVLEVIRDYDVTWPVVFDFEICGTDRLKGVSDSTVTDNAIAFMDYIAQAGYTPMLYCSRNMLRDNFEVGRLGSFRVWVAQYTELTNKYYPAPHAMWQCASDGLVPGIDTWVDLNLAYEDLGAATSPVLEPTVQEKFKGFTFKDVWDTVELKHDTNLRISPYLDYPNKYRMIAAGKRLLRTGVDEKNGWSRLEINGVTVYTLTERLTYIGLAPTTTTTTTTATTTTTTTSSTTATETTMSGEDASQTSTEATSSTASTDTVTTAVESEELLPPDSSE